MSWWSRLWRGGRGAGESGAAIAGTWSVVDISGPHPFGSYTLELREDGTLAWQANVPTKEGGEFDVSGSGTWHADGTTLHYTSGEGAGTCPYSIEGGNLVLAGLPATKLSRETRARPKPGLQERDGGAGDSRSRSSCRTSHHGLNTNAAPTAMNMKPTAWFHRSDSPM